MLFGAVALGASVEVEVPGYGTLRGNRLPAIGVDEFLGVRFAEPPVAALRWAAPVKFMPRPGGAPIDSTRHGPNCVQSLGCLLYTSPSPRDS